MIIQSGDYVMSTTTTILPTLDSQSILTNPVDILSYIIRYYCTAPKSISDTTPTLMISLADDVSRYQNDSGMLINIVTTALQSVLNQYFPSPNASSTVDVSTSDNGDNTYNLTIQLVATVNGAVYTIGADVSVNSAGILLLKFHPGLPSFS
jgi:hypothetical protein